MGNRLRRGAAAVAMATAASMWLAPAAVADEAELVAAGSVWRYSDDGAGPGTGWKSAAFDDRAWRSGPAQLGYGDGDEATTVAAGQLTYYLRTTFEVADPAAVTSLRLEALVDDGAIVFLNGTEIWRDNVAGGEATEFVVGADERQWQQASVATSALQAGTNVLAVRVHNFAESSSDISFDAALTAGSAQPPAAPEPQPPAEPAPEPPAAESVQTMCRIDNASLREISGLASSVQHPGILWAHNDSGDSARIFAVDAATCAIRARVSLSGVNAQDFESISVGRDETGRPEIWVGDTGDNYATRGNVKLYRFPEPTTLADQSVSVRTVTVTWSDGARDSEGMIVEPVPNGRVYLVSKEANGGMYELRGDFRADGTATTTRVINVRGFVTDAATAPDRSRTVVRSGDYGSLLTGLPGSAPQSIRFPAQAQGEAVTFSLDGRFLFIASEGATDLIRIPVSTL